MPIQRLPDDPKLEQFKDQAKLLRDCVRAGVPQAIEMVEEFHPRLQGLVAGSLEAAGFQLTAAQLVVARRHGFASWAKLRSHLGVIARYRRTPHLAPAAADPADEFLRLACLTHGNSGEDEPGRWRRAVEVLAAHPELPAASIHVAAAVGDVAAARALLAADPGCAAVEGGPHRWEPLLYLAYSMIDDRVDGRSHLEVARLLLAAGADPNAGYLWTGLTWPYTVLTGALSSSHSHPLDLARLLLKAGAEANDAQLTYELLGSGDETEVHELLYEFGFGRGRGGVWHRRLGSALATPAQLAENELVVAAANGWPRRLSVVLDHPVNVEGIGTNHPVLEGLTAYEQAVMNGHPAAVAVLDAAGARPSAPDPERDFLGACMRADRSAVEAMLAADPGLVERAKARRPHQISVAADQDRFGAVRLMVDLGFDVNASYRYPHQQTALHGAAFNGNVQMVRYLIEHGADVNAEDCSFHATPGGWAEHNGKAEVVAYFDELNR